MWGPGPPHISLLHSLLRSDFIGLGLGCTSIQISSSCERYALLCSAIFSSFAASNCPVSLLFVFVYWPCARARAARGAPRCLSAARPLAVMVNKRATLGFGGAGIFLVGVMLLDSHREASAQPYTESPASASPVSFLAQRPAAPAATTVQSYVFSNFDSNPVRTKKLEFRS